MTLERRIARAERVLKMFVRKGRKYRTEFRDNFRMLVNAQIATEDQLKRTDEQIKRTDEQIKRTDEQLESFASKTEQALDRLAAGQAKTDEALRRFINSLNKSRNGNSED